MLYLSFLICTKGTSTGIGRIACTNALGTFGTESRSQFSEMTTVDAIIQNAGKRVGRQKEERCFPGLPGWGQSVSVVPESPSGGRRA